MVGAKTLKRNSMLNRCLVRMKTTSTSSSAWRRVKKRIALKKVNDIESNDEMNQENKQLITSSKKNNSVEMKEIVSLEEINQRMDTIAMLQRSLPSADVLISLVKQQNDEKALQSMDAYRQLIGTPQSYAFFQRILQLCIDTGNCVQAVETVENMTKQHFFPSVLEAEAVLTCCEKASAPVHYLHAIHGLQDVLPRNTVQPYHTLLRLCEKGKDKNDVHTAVQCIRDLRAKGRPVSSKVYYTFLSRAVDDWDNIGFFELLVEMRVDGREP